MSKNVHKKERRKEKVATFDGNPSGIIKIYILAVTVFHLRQILYSPAVPGEENNLSEALGKQTCLTFVVKKNERKEKKRKKNKEIKREEKEREKMIKWGGGGGGSLRLKEKRSDMTEMLGVFFFPFTLQIDSHSRFYRRG